MITGIVKEAREPTVTLVIRGPSGTEWVVDAVLDTGFTGHLTLPVSVAAALGLTRVGRGRVILGNGSEEEFDVYQASVLWDGRDRPVEADAAEVQSLLGMALLEGHELRMRVVTDGELTIQPLA